MDEQEIDIEKLINLIHERPVLWDKSIDEYKSRYLTLDLWKEVCRELFDDFDSLSDKQKNDCGKAVIKKWTNLKDSLFRSEKKRASQKTFGERTMKVRKYIYHDQLAFLKKNWAPKTIKFDNPPETDSWISFPTVKMENIEEIEESCPGSTFTEKSNSSNDDTIKKRKFDEIYKDNFNILEKSDEHHFHFFKAILPTIRQLDEDDTLKFQLGVIQLLRNIRKERLSTSCCSHTVTSAGTSSSATVHDSEQREYSSSDQTGLDKNTICQSANSVAGIFPGHLSSSSDLTQIVKVQECMNSLSQNSPVSTGQSPIRVDFTTN